MPEKNEPMETLQRAGWRMRTPLAFVRRGAARKELLLCARNGWLYCAGGNVRRVGETLAEAVAAVGAASPR